MSKLKIRTHYDQRSGRISLNPKFGVNRWHGGLLEALGYGDLLEALGYGGLLEDLGCRFKARQRVG